MLVQHLGAAEEAQGDDESDVSLRVEGDDERNVIEDGFGKGHDGVNKPNGNKKDGV